MIKYRDEIKDFANQFGLKPELVAAIVNAESSFSTFAVRFEKDYKWLFEPETNAKTFMISTDTEIALQSFSYGLMQVMGATCRWLGFKAFMYELLKPEVGLYWGCLYLSTLMKKHGDIGKAVSSYNAGSPRRTPDGQFVNQKYVDKVIGKMNEYIKAGSFT